jgi:hypothetical protein
VAGTTFVLLRGNMSEFINSQILRLKNGDKLIVDRGDKPGVIIFAVAEGSSLNIHLDSAMHVVAHDEDSVSRAFVELQLLDLVFSVGQSFFHFRGSLVQFRSVFCLFNLLLVLPLLLFFSLDILEIPAEGF